MILRLEHIGIAVKNLAEAEEVFSMLLGEKHYKHESVESEKVITSFYKAGESKLELLESSSPESAIARSIDKRGEGIHHLAFEVDDIIYEMDRLKNLGFQVLSEKPMKGADNKLVCFLHPKSTKGVLVELCQTIPA